MLRITKWIEEHMFFGSKREARDFNRPCLDTMQYEAIQQLQESRKFMVSAIDAISAKYHNENKAG